jgi:hypothetical protein
VPSEKRPRHLSRMVVRPLKGETAALGKWRSAERHTGSRPLSADQRSRYIVLLRALCAMRAPPDERTRPAVTPGAFRKLILDGTSTSRIVDEDDGLVVDLDGYRIRRLLRPWPGWWGGHELRSATWAERSHRGPWSA